MPAANSMDRRPVRLGIGTLDRPMTSREAQRYGQRHMPQALRRAGFETVIFTSDEEIHGARFFRINYGMKCARARCLRPT